MSTSPVASLPSATLLDRIDSNHRRTRRVVAAVAVVPAVLLAVLGAVAGVWPVGVVLGVAVAAAVVWAAWRDLEASVLDGLGARPPDPTKHARLGNIVEGLCLAAGVPMPTVLVLDDDRPNALAVGREPRRATLVVTSGLLDTFERVELEAVVAHELSHVRSHDIEPATMAVRLGRLPVVGPALRDALLDEARESLADLNGVAMTRYPPGLVAALAKLDGSAPPGPPASWHLWLASPSSDLNERAQALREL